jgi:quercetin dioxygenase-like cupin family protein
MSPSRLVVGRNVFREHERVKGLRLKSRRLLGSHDELHIFQTSSLAPHRVGPQAYVFQSPPFNHNPMTTSNARTVTWFKWDEMSKETVSPMLDRRLITGDRMMLAHVYLKKGCIVPKHSHENEQITYILEGALKFWIGADESEIVMVRAGEVLHIPSNVPHKAEAMEDTLDVDIFDPPRADWLNKTDSYLRK